MSSKIVVPDVLNIDLRLPLVMSSITSNTRKTSQPVHHSLAPTYLRPDDSSVHTGFLEGLPQVRARLDAR